MGNRRLSRKRLYQVEKAGQAIDLESGAGISECVISATQHRQGQEIITEILLDLGSSKLGSAITASGTEDKVCARAGLSGAITKMTVAKFGVVTEVRAIVLEVTNKDVDVAVAAQHDVVQGGATLTTNYAEVLADATTAVGFDESADIDDATVRSLYITDGSSISGAITQGKIAIYIHGFEVPADL